MNKLEKKAEFRVHTYDGVRRRSSDSLDADGALLEAARLLRRSTTEGGPHEMVIVFEADDTTSWHWDAQQGLILPRPGGEPEGSGPALPTESLLSRMQLTSSEAFWDGIGLHPPSNADRFRAACDFVFTSTLKGGGPRRSFIIVWEEGKAAGVKLA